ncbi:unnamed protein product [Ectocarpus sp. 12 AP-2014]
MTRWCGCTVFKSPTAALRTTVRIEHCLYDRHPIWRRSLPAQAYWTASSPSHRDCFRQYSSVGFEDISRCFSRVCRLPAAISNCLLAKLISFPPPKTTNQP